MNLELLNKLSGDTQHLFNNLEFFNQHRKENRLDVLYDAIEELSTYLKTLLESLPDRSNVDRKVGKKFITLIKRIDELNKHALRITNNVRFLKRVVVDSDDNQITKETYSFVEFSFLDILEKINLQLQSIESDENYLKLLDAQTVEPDYYPQMDNQEKAAFKRLIKTYSPNYLGVSEKEIEKENERLMLLARFHTSVALGDLYINGVQPDASRLLGEYFLPGARFVFDLSNLDDEQQLQFQRYLMGGNELRDTSPLILQRAAATHALNGEGQDIHETKVKPLVAFKNSVEQRLRGNPNHFGLNFSAGGFHQLDYDNKKEPFLLESDGRSGHIYYNKDKRFPNGLLVGSEPSAPGKTHLLSGVNHGPTAKSGHMSAYGGKKIDDSYQGSDDRFPLIGSRDEDKNKKYNWARVVIRPETLKQLVLDHQDMDPGPNVIELLSKPHRNAVEVKDFHKHQLEMNLYRDKHHLSKVKSTKNKKLKKTKQKISIELDSDRIISAQHYVDQSEFQELANRILSTPLNSVKRPDELLITNVNQNIFAKDDRQTYADMMRLVKELEAIRNRGLKAPLQYPLPELNMNLLILHITMAIKELTSYQKRDISNPMSSRIEKLQEAYSNLQQAYNSVVENSQQSAIQRKWNTGFNHPAANNCLEKLYNHPNFKLKLAELNALDANATIKSLSKIDSELQKISHQVMLNEFTGSNNAILIPTLINSIYFRLLQAKSVYQTDIADSNDAINHTIAIHEINKLLQELDNEFSHNPASQKAPISAGKKLDILKSILSKSEYTQIKSLIQQFNVDASILQNNFAERMQMQKQAYKKAEKVFAKKIIPHEEAIQEFIKAINLMRRNLGIFFILEDSAYQKAVSTFDQLKMIEELFIELADSYSANLNDTQKIEILNRLLKASENYSKIHSHISQFIKFISRSNAIHLGNTINNDARDQRNSFDLNINNLNNGGEDIEVELEQPDQYDSNRFNSDQPSTASELSPRANNNVKYLKKEYKQILQNLNALEFTEDLIPTTIANKNTEIKNFLKSLRGNLDFQNILLSSKKAIDKNENKITQITQLIDLINYFEVIYTDDLNVASMSAAEIVETAKNLGFRSVEIHFNQIKVDISKDIKQPQQNQGELESKYQSKIEVIESNSSHSNDLSLDDVGGEATLAYDNALKLIVTAFKNFPFHSGELNQVEDFTSSLTHELDVLLEDIELDVHPQEFSLTVTLDELDAPLADLDLHSKPKLYSIIALRNFIEELNINWTASVPELLNTVKSFAQVASQIENGDMKTLSKNLQSWAQEYFPQRLKLEEAAIYKKLAEINVTATDLSIEDNDNLLQKIMQMNSVLKQLAINIVQLNNEFLHPNKKDIDKNKKKIEAISMLSKRLNDLALKIKELNNPNHQKQNKSNYTLLAKYLDKVMNAAGDLGAVKLFTRSIQHGLKNPPTPNFGKNLATKPLVQKHTEPDGRGVVSRSIIENLLQNSEVYVAKTKKIANENDQAEKLRLSAKLDPEVQKTIMKKIDASIDPQKILEIYLHYIIYRLDILKSRAENSQSNNVGGAATMGILTNKFFEVIDNSELTAVEKLSEIDLILKHSYNDNSTTTTVALTTLKKVNAHVNRHFVELRRDAKQKEKEIIEHIKKFNISNDSIGVFNQNFRKLSANIHAQQQLYIPADTKYKELEKILQLIDNFVSLLPDNKKNINMNALETILRELYSASSNQKHLQGLAQILMQQFVNYDAETNVISKKVAAVNLPKNSQSLKAAFSELNNTIKKKDTNSESSQENLDSIEPNEAPSNTNPGPNNSLNLNISTEVVRNYSAIITDLQHALTSTSLNITKSLDLKNTRMSTLERQQLVDFQERFETSAMELNEVRNDINWARDLMQRPDDAPQKKRLSEHEELSMFSSLYVEFQTYLSEAISTEVSINEVSYKEVLLDEISSMAYEHKGKVSECFYELDTLVETLLELEDAISNLNESLSNIQFEQGDFHIEGPNNNLVVKIQNLIATQRLIILHLQRINEILGNDVLAYQDNHRKIAAMYLSVDQLTIVQSLVEGLNTEYSQQAIKEINIPVIFDMAFLNIITNKANEKPIVKFFRSLKNAAANEFENALPLAPNAVEAQIGNIPELANAEQILIDINDDELTAIDAIEIEPQQNRPPVVNAKPTNAMPIEIEVEDIKMDDNVFTLEVGEEEYNEYDTNTELSFEINIPKKERLSHFEREYSLIKSRLDRIKLNGDDTALDAEIKSNKIEDELVHLINNLEQQIETHKESNNTKQIAGKERELRKTQILIKNIQVLNANYADGKSIEILKGDIKAIIKSGKKTALTSLNNFFVTLQNNLAKLFSSLKVDSNLRRKNSDDISDDIYDVNELKGVELTENLNSSYSIINHRDSIITNVENNNEFNKELSRIDLPFEKISFDLLQTEVTKQILSSLVDSLNQILGKFKKNLPSEKLDTISKMINYLLILQIELANPVTNLLDHNRQLIAAARLLNNSSINKLAEALETAAKNYQANILSQHEDVPEYSEDILPNLNFAGSNASKTPEISEALIEPVPDVPAAFNKANQYKIQKEHDEIKEKNIIAEAEEFHKLLDFQKDVLEVETLVSDAKILVEALQDEGNFQDNKKYPNLHQATDLLDVLEINIRTRHLLASDIPMLQERFSELNEELNNHYSNSLAKIAVEKLQQLEEKFYNLLAHNFYSRPIRENPITENLSTLTNEMIPKAESSSKFNWSGVFQNEIAQEFYDHISKMMPLDFEDAEDSFRKADSSSKILKIENSLLHALQMVVLQKAVDSANPSRGIDLFISYMIFRIENTKEIGLSNSTQLAALNDLVTRLTEIKENTHLNAVRKLNLILDKNALATHKNIPMVGEFIKSAKILNNNLNSFIKKLPKKSRRIKQNIDNFQFKNSHHSANTLQTIKDNISGLKSLLIKYRDALEANDDLNTRPIHQTQINEIDEIIQIFDTIDDSENTNLREQEQIKVIIQKLKDVKSRATTLPFNNFVKIISLCQNEAEDLSQNFGHTRLDNLELYDQFNKALNKAQIPRELKLQIQIVFDQKLSTEGSKLQSELLERLLEDFSQLDDSHERLVVQQKIAEKLAYSSDITEKKNLWMIETISGIEQEIADLESVIEENVQIMVQKFAIDLDPNAYQKRKYDAELASELMEQPAESKAQSNENSIRATVIPKPLFREFSSITLSDFTHLSKSSYERLQSILTQKIKNASEAKVQLVKDTLGYLSKVQFELDKYTSDEPTYKNISKHQRDNIKLLYEVVTTGAIQPGSAPFVKLQENIQHLVNQTELDLDQFTHLDMESKKLLKELDRKKDKISDSDKLNLFKNVIAYLHTVEDELNDLPVESTKYSDIQKHQQNNIELLHKIITAPSMHKGRKEFKELERNINFLVQPPLDNLQKRKFNTLDMVGSLRNFASRLPKRNPSSPQSENQLSTREAIEQSNNAQEEQLHINNLMHSSDNSPNNSPRPNAIEIKVESMLINEPVIPEEKSPRQNELPENNHAQSKNGKTKKSSTGIFQRWKEKLQTNKPQKNREHAPQIELIDMLVNQSNPQPHSPIENQSSNVVVDDPSIQENSPAKIALKKIREQFKSYLETKNPAPTNLLSRKTTSPLKKAKREMVFEVMKLIQVPIGSNFIVQTDNDVFKPSDPIDKLTTKECEDILMYLIIKNEAIIEKNRINQPSLEKFGQWEPVVKKRKERGTVSHSIFVSTHDINHAETVFLAQHQQSPITIQSSNQTTMDSIEQENRKINEDNHRKGLYEFVKEMRGDSDVKSWGEVLENFKKNLDPNSKLAKIITEKVEKKSSLRPSKSED